MTDESQNRSILPRAGANSLFNSGDGIMSWFGKTSSALLDRMVILYPKGSLITGDIRYGSTDVADIPLSVIQQARWWDEYLSLPWCIADGRTQTSVEAQFPKGIFWKGL